MVKRFLIAIVLLGLVAGGLVWFNFFRDRMISEFFANMPVQPVSVSTFEAQPVTWSPVIETIGSVNASQGVDLTTETSGVVRAIHFASNQAVERDTLLLQLDDVVQRADLEAARTQYDLDRDNLVRAQELQRRGVTASVSLENSQAAARVSEAQLARAQAVLDQRELSAPFAGTIGIPRVDLGQFISPGDTVATLQDMDMMRVDFTVPEQRLRELRIGQPISVRIEGDDEAFTGDIQGIDPRVDARSRLVSVRGTVANTGRALTPGQFVRIEVALPPEDGVIALPQTAVVTSLYGDYVFLVQPRANDAAQLEVRQSFVEIGRRSGSLVEIRRGVSAGDQVVTAGQNRLNNGQPAVVNNEVNPSVPGQAPTVTGTGAPAQGAAGQ